MRLLVPHQVTLLESNVPAAALSAWSVASSYSEGAQVIHETTINGFTIPHIYRALQTSTGKEPAYPGTEFWLWIGPDDRRAMFDGHNTSSTTTADGESMISVRFELPRRGATIAIIGIKSAGEVVVRQYENGDTTTPNFTYTQPSSIPPEGPASWYTWLFGEYTAKETVVVDLPGGYVSPWIEVDIAGELASVAQCLHCDAYEIGITDDAPVVGVLGYSPFQTNEFGVTRFVPRRNKRELDVSINIDSDYFDPIFSTLRRHENQLILLDGNNSGAQACAPQTDRDALRLYGKMTRIVAPLSYERSLIDIRIEEL